MNSIYLFLILLSSFNIQTKPNKMKSSDVDCYVPNAETAIKVAEAIWLPIYGKKIYEYTPFHAELEKDTWIIYGTPKAQKGGTPNIEISKKDCKIIDVYFSK